MDIESVHAIAPGARIVYVGAATNGNNDIVAAVNLVVQDSLASIVSDSWEIDIETVADADAAVLDPILIQAGLKGIGFHFASGDWGDNQCACPFFPGFGYGVPGVAYPGSSPYVTDVGGTSLFLNRDGSRAYETGWEVGDSVLVGHGSKQQWSPAAPGYFIFGAGGGTSQVYAQPKYQRHLVPAPLAGTPARRVTPDVAMLADFDSGVMLGVTDTTSGAYTVWANAGGTSLATPLFAAAVALAEQRAGRHIGFGNPTFDRAAPGSFFDIAPTPSPQSITHATLWTDALDPAVLLVQRPDGTLATHELHSAPGFDNVTGLGVPNGQAFLKAISGK
jgi:subtilase family serine protease